MKFIGGHKVLIERGDTLWSIAKAVTGDGSRWADLVTANPTKPTAPSGNFQTLLAGEKLFLPLTWPDVSPMATPTPAPPSEARGWDDSPNAGALPLGWLSTDLQIVKELARVWGSQPEDLLVTWFEESGLRPHDVTPFGSAPDGGPAVEYAGLIAGLTSMWSGGKRVYPIDQTFGWSPGTWKKIVQTTPIATQLQAIAQIWDRLFKTYLRNETIGSFAARMGVSPAAVMHALNFLPARIASLQSGDASITKSTDHDPGTRSGSFYGDNPGLDVNKDGKITLKDLDAHGKLKLAELEGSHLGPIVAEARTAPQNELASLFAPLTPDWERLTGRSPVTNVGYSPSQLGEGSGGAGGLFVAAAIGTAIWLFFFRKKRGKG